MMGLETLKSAIGLGETGAPLTEEELREEQLADAAALKLVLQDADVATKYISSKELPQQWEKINNLYRAFVASKPWPGSQKKRSNLSMPVVLEAIENILAQIHMAFFSDPQPFLLTAKGKTKPEAARAASTVLSWALKQARTKEEIRKILKSILEYGQGIGFWGWQTGEHEKAEYSRDEKGNVKKHLERTEVAAPTFEISELTNTLVDPSLRNHDARNARFVIRQMFITADDLESLDAAGYKNVPTREELVAILTNSTEATEDSMKSSKYESNREYQAEKQTNEFSANPLSQPLELLEWWSEDSVVTVLQRKIVLRNEDNEFGRIPVLSCSFIDVLGSFFGFGVGILLEGEQRFQTGVVNAWIDGLSLTLNPMYHRKKGLGAMTQNINSAPGKVVNDDGELTPIPVTSNSPEALNALQSSEARATRRVGANFGADMPTQALRTAEGVNAFSSGVQIRLQYFIENFADLVYVPLLEAFLQMCKDYLQPKQIQQILSDEDGKAYEGDVLDLYNGSYSLEVLSSTKVAARRSMATLLPQLVQLFISDPVQQSMTAQNKKVNYVELVNQAIDLTGWPAQDLIIEMTKEDAARAQAMNPAVIAAQSRAQDVSQKHQNDMQLEESKATGRAGVQVVRHILDQSSETVPEETKPLALALTGEASGSQAPAPEGPVPEQTGGSGVPRQI